MLWMKPKESKPNLEDLLEEHNSIEKTQKDYKDLSDRKAKIELLLSTHYATQDVIFKGYVYEIGQPWTGKYSNHRHGRVNRRKIDRIIN